jgi:lysophospholipase L1-like esterase
MGQGEDERAVAWSVIPTRRPAGRLPLLVAAVVPFLAVLGPLVAMHLHGNIPGQIRRVGAIGLAGAVVVAVAGWRRWPRWVVVAVAAVVGVAITVLADANPVWGTWVGAGLVFAGAIGTIPALMAVVLAVARGIGHAVRLVLLVPLALVVVVVPWLVNTVARLDPLAAPRTPGTGWLRRRQREVLPAQPWTADSLVARHSLARRARSFAVWPAIVVGALLLARLPTRHEPAPAAIRTPEQAIASADTDEDVPLDDTVSTGPDGQPLRPFDGAEWYPEWVRDMAWIENVNTGWQPLQPHRIGDVHTRWINVEDGVRASWHPPACGCRRLKVWMYGGSTMFGLGQRDDHTIASELARAAWKQGIALDVDNRGVVGDVHWQEANRYAWDLATYGPPDLVIFYDGINDTTATQTLIDRQEGDRYAQVDFQNDDQWSHILDALPQPPPDPLPGAEVVHPPKVVLDGLDQFADLLMKRYDRSREISRNLSSDDHVPTYYLWQPDRLSRPQIPGEPEDGPGSENGRQREAAIQRVIPNDVVDLSNVFDRTKRALFYDDQHHNEIGARILGEALARHLEPDLRRLLRGQKVDAAP